METNITTTGSLQIKNLIYTIRGQQVMLDSDLAMLYKVTTGRLNEQVKRNIKRFPERFMFQLTEDEYKSLMSQFAISNKNSGRGGRRKLPYVFTEQGIAMLSSVLRSEQAIEISIGIMDAFVEMRRFWVHHQVLFSRIDMLELKQLEYQKSTDEKLEQVFDYIAANKEVLQKVFFNGQIYDAFSLLVDMVKQANKTIILVDNYVDIATLNILAKRKDNVKITIYTSSKNDLTAKDINVFNRQYKTLIIKYINTFHDKFMILDDSLCYHIGASIKDAGKRSFAISKIEDTQTVKDILKRLK